MSNPASADHAGARAALTMRFQAGDWLAITAQVIYEFGSVATRPAQANGVERLLTANSGDFPADPAIRIFTP